MATPLRSLSYRYQWVYDTVSRIAALSVGGEGRFRRLAWQAISLTDQSQILDLCCGSGQTTQLLVATGAQVTGLDASPRSLRRAQQAVPGVEWVEAWAEAMPFEGDRFDLVHTSVALHEMQPPQRRDIFQEVWRVLRPGGTFALIDFHRPHNPLLWPGLALFLWLFETETAWQMLQADLAAELAAIGFQPVTATFHAQGSLQVVQARKPDGQ
ncbi:MAG: methyltransferase domain-containing protein [Leptolyngbya sp.]|nr:methyltransferase domain-containing protein [Leptolyngbya sp.]